MKTILAFAFIALAACSHAPKKQECKECAESEKAYEAGKSKDSKDCGCDKDKMDHANCKEGHKH